MRTLLVVAALAPLLTGCSVTGFARYALPRSAVGDLQVGESAPDPAHTGNINAAAIPRYPRPKPVTAMRWSVMTRSRAT